MDSIVLQKFLFELLGTMIMIFMGDGVCACVTLNKSKGQNSGWIVITLAWGFAVMCGVLIAGPVSGAHLNPAVTLGLAAAGLFSPALIVPYIVAQMIGGFFGAVLVWLFYKDHYDITEDANAKLGTFCTAPAIRHYSQNLLCEVIATFVLLLCIISCATVNAEGFAMLGPIPVTFLIMALGMSLGGTTGYAMNPARDLGPRFAHYLLPMKSNKRDSDWSYAWVPIIGPLIGGPLAGFVGWLLYIL